MTRSNMLVTALLILHLIAPTAACLGLTYADVDSTQSQVPRMDVYLAAARAVEDSISSLFSNPVSYSVGQSPHSVAVADFDHNGEQDVVVVNYAGNSMTVLLSDSGDFESVTDYSVGNPHSVAVLDINNDGYSDIASLNRQGSQVQIFANDQSGGFAFAGGYVVGADPHALSTGYLNDDSFQDIVVANTDEPGSVTLYFGNGMGQLVNRIDIDVQYRAVHVTCADVSCDGRQDIVLAGFFTNSILILQNTGDGSFVAQTPIAVGSLPWATACVDLDGDDVLDLVSADFGSDSITCLFNDGDGGFSATTSYQVGTNPHFVLCADLDGDELADIVTADWGDNAVSVLLGVGEGLFAYGGQYSVGAQPVSIAFYDADLDDDLDAVTANYNSNSITRLLNSGASTLPLPLNLRLNNEDHAHVINHTPYFVWTYSGEENTVQQSVSIEVGIDQNWQTSEQWSSGALVTSDSLVQYGGEPLLDGDKYFARVRLADSTDWGSWRYLSFQMNTAPTTPGQLLPADGNIVQLSQPNLTVRNPADAEGDSLLLTFEITNDSSFAFFVSFTAQAGSDSLTTVSVPFYLTEDQRYWWRVKASDYYEESAYSTIWSFWLNSENIAPTPFELRSPPDGLTPALTTTTPILQWTRSRDFDPFDSVRYELHIALYPNFSFATIIAGITDTTYQIGEPLSWGTNYWWKVKATDLSTGVTWSDQVYSFRVMKIGDPDGNGFVTISDAVFLINYIFAGGPAPVPLLSGDADCSGAISISDAVYLINYIFAAGPAPCEP